MANKLTPPRLGTKFGRLTVLFPEGRKRKKDGKRSHAKTALCICECGKLSAPVISDLIHGRSKSCGCLQKDRAKEAKTKHGYSSTYLGRALVNIKCRCTNPNNNSFHNYGGRGIKCLLNNPQEILDDIGHRPSDQYSIDRIDNDGHYEAGNIRWATKETQANNRRGNVEVTWQGETRTVTQWEYKLGLGQKTLYNRLFHRGWSIERAMTTPAGKQGRRSK